MRLQTMTTLKKWCVLVIILCLGIGLGMLIEFRRASCNEERLLDRLFTGNVAQKKIALLKLGDTTTGIAYIGGLFPDAPMKHVDSQTRNAAICALVAMPHIRELLPRIALAAFADSDPDVRMAAVIAMENYYQESVCGALKILVRALDKEPSDELLQAKLRALALYTGLDYVWMNDLLKTNSVASLRDVVEARLSCATSVVSRACTQYDTRAGGKP